MADRSRGPTGATTRRVFDQESGAISVQASLGIAGRARGEGARRPVWARFAPRFEAGAVRVAKRGRFLSRPAGQQGVCGAFRRLGYGRAGCPTGLGPGPGSGLFSDQPGPVRTRSYPVPYAAPDSSAAWAAGRPGRRSHQAGAHTGPAFTPGRRSHRAGGRTGPAVTPAKRRQPCRRPNGRSHCRPGRRRRERRWPTPEAPRRHPP
jgi:hypothetical protein